MKIAIIGAGNMGGAIARALAQSDFAQNNSIYISNRSKAKLDILKESFPQLLHHYRQLRGCQLCRHRDYCCQTMDTRLCGTRDCLLRQARKLHDNLCRSSHTVQPLRRTVLRLSPHFPCHSQHSRSRRRRYIGHCRQPCHSSTNRACAIDFQQHGHYHTHRRRPHQCLHGTLFKRDSSCHAIPTCRYGSRYCHGHTCRRSIPTGCIYHARNRSTHHFSQRAS